MRFNNDALSVTVIAIAGVGIIAFGIAMMTLASDAEKPQDLQQVFVKCYSLKSDTVILDRSFIGSVQRRGRGNYAFVLNSTTSTTLEISNATCVVDYSPVQKEVTHD